MQRTLTALLLASALPALALAAPPVITWEEADQHVGEEVIVEGRMLGLHCSRLSCLLAFEPTFNRFTAVIQANHFNDFPPPAELEKRYTGKRVRVHGTVRRNESKPEIPLEHPEDLALAAGLRRKEQEDARAAQAQAQAEVLERLTAVLERVQDLVERMAATQERMDTLLAQLEQRSLELAAAQPPPPPGPPTYGEPQPRPAYEAMRTIKRGMSRADVARLVGDPITIDEQPGGGATWNYGFGRSVTFDGRGRAQSLVGFPPP